MATTFTFALGKGIPFVRVYFSYFFLMLVDLLGLRNFASFDISTIFQATRATTSAFMFCFFFVLFLMIR